MTEITAVFIHALYKFLEVRYESLCRPSIDLIHRKRQENQDSHRNPRSRACSFPPRSVALPPCARNGSFPERRWGPLRRRLVDSFLFLSFAAECRSSAACVRSGPGLNEAMKLTRFTDHHRAVRCGRAPAHTHIQTKRTSCVLRAALYFTPPTRHHSLLQ
jgi:hypothetical protein